MSVLGNLQASYVINTLFDVYIGKNHHYTKMGINAEILGEPPLDNDEIFYTLDQGNQMDKVFPYYNVLQTATATGGSNNTITGNFAGLGLLTGLIIDITGGTGAGQTRIIDTYTSTTITIADGNWVTNPDATSQYRIVHSNTFYHLRTDFANRPVNFYLPHDHYTFWVMAYDQYGVPKVSRFYINTNELLANMSPLYNTESPVIINHSISAITPNPTVTVQAKQGETVRIYYEYHMDNDRLGDFWPDSHDGFVTINGQLHQKRRGTPFTDTPLASGIVSNANGQITLTVSSGSIPRVNGVAMLNLRVVASAQAPGKGQSFMTAPVNLRNVQSYGDGDTKQSRIFLTATNSTRTAGVRVPGTTERLHNAEAKQYDSLTGAETTPDQQYYRYNFTNDDNPSNYHLISGGIWLPIGLTTNLIFKHEQAGLQTTWWGNSFAVTGVSTTTRTAFISREDAWTRGRDPALVKDTLTWFSATWAVGDKVYLNDNPTDLSTAGDGHYWINAQGVAITIAGGQGVISHREVPTNI